MNSLNNNEFLFACMQNHLQIVKFLYTHKCGIHQHNFFENNGFLISCGNGYCKITPFLWNQKCGIEHMNREGMNGLLMACREGQLKIIQSLIMLKNHGINQINHLGKNGFQIAFENNFYKIISYFYEFGKFSIHKNFYSFSLDAKKILKIENERSQRIVEILTFENKLNIILKLPTSICEEIFMFVHGRKNLERKICI